MTIPTTAELFSETEDPSAADDEVTADNQPAPEDQLQKRGRDQIPSVMEQFRNARMEALLDRLSCRWHMQYVPLEEFDVERSLNNQNRLEQLDIAHADAIAEGFRQGDKIPAITAHVVGTKNGMKVILDGNHRFAGKAKTSSKKIATYVVTDATPKARTIIAKVANIGHGKALTETERIQHAIHLVNSDMTLRDASAEMHVSEAKVSRALARQESELRASRNGIPSKDWNEKLKESVRNRLAIIHTDEGFRAATRFAIRANLSYNQLHDLVQEMNRSRSGKTQEEVVEAWEVAHRAQIQDAGGGAYANNSKKGMTPKGRTMMVLGSLLTLEDLPSLAPQFAPEERDAVREKTKLAIERLTTFLAGLER
jgi:hypothetical protein